MTVILPPTVWVCANGCGTTDRTPGSVPNRFHPCGALAGMLSPLVPEGLSCKVEAREREDYVGQEQVQYDAGGRPVMSVVTTRDEGQDCIAFAPCATVRMVN